MKKNWKGRSIVSLFVVCIGLYGSWYSSSQPFEEYIINLIILGPIYFVIIYFISGFIFRIKENKTNKTSEDVYKKPSETYNEMNPHMKNIYIILGIGILAFLAYYFYFSAVATCVREFPSLNRTKCEMRLNRT